MAEQSLRKGEVGGSTPLIGSFNFTLNMLKCFKYERESISTTQRT